MFLHVRAPSKKWIDMCGVDAGLARRGRACVRVDGGLARIGRVGVGARLGGLLAARRYHCLLLRLCFCMHSRRPGSEGQPEGPRSGEVLAANGGRGCNL